MPENSQDWRAALPEDLRSHESLKDFKDPGSLAKSYIETKAMVGSSMRLPGPDASAEDKAAFVAKLAEKFPDTVYLPKSDEEAAGLEKQLWEKLGRPSDPKGYDLKDVDLGGVELDVAGLAKMGAELGWTKGQFKAFAKGLAKSQNEQKAQALAQQAELKKEWGAAFAEKVNAAAEVAKKLNAPAATIEAIKAGRLPLEQMRFFDGLVGAVGGSGRQVGDQGNGAGKITPDEAKLRLEEVYRRVYDPKTTPSEGAALTKKIAELMPQAFPGEASDEEAG